MLADADTWKAERLAQGGNLAEPFLTSQRAGATARPLARHTPTILDRVPCSWASDFAGRRLPDIASGAGKRIPLVAPDGSS